MKNYLWYFSQYKIRTLKKDRSEADFFHFLDMLPAGGTVLDIGANLGLMSYFLAEKCSLVHAIEPMPLNLKNLQRLKKQRGLDNLQIHPFALGEKNGQIELVMPVVKGVLKQGLSHVVHPKMEAFTSGKTFSCPVWRLDELQLQDLDNLSGIKLDVENFEFEVLKGGVKLIERQRPLIYTELWDNKNRRDCIALLESMAYETCVLKDGELVSYRLAESSGQNFFFIPLSN